MKTYTVTFDPSALADLADQFDYLEPRAGQRIAEAHLARLFAYCLDLKTFPKRGRARDDVRPGLRLVGYRGQATIAFTVVGQTVMILRIFFAGRQIEGFDEPTGG